MLSTTAYTPSSANATSTDCKIDDSGTDYGGFGAQAEDDIRNLARTVTRETAGRSEIDHALSRVTSNATVVPGCSPFAGDMDPRLDPNSPSFNSKFWIRNLQQLAYTDTEYYKPSSLGLFYKDLRTYGEDSGADYQSNFGNVLYKAAAQAISRVKPSSNSASQVDILKPMDGIIRAGKVTVVLGRPGAGCTTFLKTIAAQTHGFHVDSKSVISYDGLSPEDIQKNFRGEVVYCAETENHFPHMTVGDTLTFAARMRTPQNRPLGVSRDQYATHMADVAMATFGLSHTRNSKVGNDYIRGVSGGERKRVSIAEVYLAQARIQCWDNSTRGLDSATALEFVRALKTSASVSNSTSLVAIYQCSQDAYDLFDDVVLLYEGYQIYYGSATKAKDYFVRMGFHCPPRQTTADFLTSLTNPMEREVTPGFEDRVPRTPKEFSDWWNTSPERSLVVAEIDRELAGGKAVSKRQEFTSHYNARQAESSRKQSPFTVSFAMQVKYLMGRNILLTKGDPSVVLFTVIGNSIIAIIIGSLFINLKKNTHDFFARTAVVFLAVLFNAFSSLLEILSLYDARPIVEKHKKFAFYHPSADAVASIITELVPKVLTCLFFNIILYFMVHLRRSAGHFFYYLLMNFLATLVMSHLFRTIGALTTSIASAMTPASVLLLALSIFTGFVIPPQQILGWCRWMYYLDPIAYVFEGLVANEFHSRNFDCSAFVPSGSGYSQFDGTINQICSEKGSEPGLSYVNGDAFIRTAFSFENSRKWRNFGILIAFVLVFFVTYIVAVEYNKGAMQKGEVLVFQSSSFKKSKKQTQDIEAGTSEKVRPEDELQTESTYVSKEISRPRNIFHWKNLKYEVTIKGEQRVILNDISGWVKPGQVTALMGASGAGKTTLLNALSDRLTSGVITDGVRMVNGRPLDSSFQRSIGYVQQQDLHLETSTVREALRFSAYLRQPSSVSRTEKDAYVEHVLDLLEMRAYSDAVVGVSGEGLNVEQRKRLTIGVELVAKPKLLVFLDEPTSGLDSQTAWSICKLIRKLANHGQAILCTIHQPSAMLMKEFDRLLFLQRGGQTIYFGDLGENSKVLIDYFESYGAPKCPPDANPAEWMLEVIGAAPGSHANQDYHQVWKNSKEYQAVLNELASMETELVKIPEEKNADSLKPYATSFFTQYWMVTKRVLEQNWRSPVYTYNKLCLTIASALFNGFVFFKANNSQQGLQNQMFSIFMFLFIFETLVEQYLPYFVSQRSLYEVRERPSKTFSWFVFITAQISAEIPWNILCGTFGYLCWYYPLALFNNAAQTDAVASRGATMWLALVLFFIYTSSMGQVCISFMELAQNAANLANLVFTMCLIFCGVILSKSSMPKFWLFMYRCNPFTYLVSVVLSVGLANSSVECSESELLNVVAPAGQTCYEYMDEYIAANGGYLVSESVAGACKFCTMSSTNKFLETVSANFDTRWRDIGIFIVYIAFNMLATVLFYYVARVPKGSRKT
ncbi:hypothetical protein JCM33374_g1403 [Metschnikowia sp. JCM 33374]|nr:hypothetical protein JCM33374_g1403 [Metschnikowia sp. JCM 33374]